MFRAHACSAFDDLVGEFVLLGSLAGKMSG
ncbi:MAG: hypothetical protein QOI22_2098, partial [Verrucomicrobiota bacterium]